MFIQNKFLIKSLEDDNLCWDFCGTMFNEPELKLRHRKTRTRVNAYKRIMKKDLQMIMNLKRNQLKILLAKMTRRTIKRGKKYLTIPPRRITRVIH